MSEELKKVEDVLAAINRGEDISNDDARLLASVVDSLDFAFKMQNTINSVLIETLPMMASSLAASVLSRAGRTEQKIKKAVGKIAEDHVVSLLQMITNLATNLIDNATSEAEEETK